MEKYDDLSFNIRSAFRLLIHYNERIISLIKYIGKKFKLNSVSDNTPWFTPILQDRNNLTKRDKAFNWLPMYFHEFHFENKDIQFSVFVHSDTGSWVDPDLDWVDEIDNYEDLNSSKTRIIFAITNSKKWESDIITEEYYNDFLKDENIITYKKEIIICKSFELIDFKDEKTTNNTLKRYIEYIKNKGIINIEYEE